LPKLYNLMSISNYAWNSFLVISFIFLIYLYFYIRYIGNIKETFLKILYIFGVWILLFLFFFIEIEYIFKFFFIKIDDIIVIKDIQDLVNLSLDISLIFSLYFTVPLGLFYFVIYWLNYWNRPNFYFYKFLICLFGYYFLLFKYLLEIDLFLSGWEFFNKDNTYMYDFQPDFVFLLISYIGDFYDLSIFFIIILLLLLIINSSYGFSIIWNFYNRKNFFIIKTCLEILLGFFFFYFFGGESFIRDCIIIFLTCFCLESFFFSSLFFFNLKRKKL
jgi:hypothetical protein